MKLDLSKFKKIDENEKSTLLQHPDGHSIRVAHASLAPALRNQLKKIPLNKAKGGAIQKFDDGGEVDSENSRAPASQPQAPVIVNVNGPQAPAPGSIPPSNVYSGGDFMKALTATRANPVEGNMSYPSLEAIQQAQGISPQQPPTPRGQPAPASAAPQTPQQAPVSPGPDLMANYATGAQRAIQTGISGENDKANALGALGKQDAAQYHAQADAQADLQARYQKHYQALEDERQNFMHDVQNNKIDPEHYWTNHSKVSTAIGLILGGIGGGVTGQANPASQMLQSMKDQDLRAQEANLGAKKTLLEANLRQFGNLHDAMSATRVMQNDMLASKIQEIAGNNANPVAQANAKIAIAPLMMQSAQLQQQLAMRKMLLGNSPQQGAALDSAKKISLMRTNGLIDDKQYEKANEELGNSEKTKNAHAAADNILDQIGSEQSVGNRIANPIQSKQKLAALSAQLVPLIMESNPSKRLTEESLKTEIEPLIPGFTSNSSTKENLRGQLHSLIDTHAAATPTLQGLGIAPAHHVRINRLPPKVR